MTLNQLHTELKRRDIELQMEGSKLIAADPHQRLSPSLDAFIRKHRDELVSELKAVSATFRRFQEIIDNTLVATDLESIVEDIDMAYQCGDLVQEEAEDLARAITFRSRQIPERIEDMPLKDLATSGLVRKVQSKVLGETIQFAANDCDLADVDPTMIVYTATELAQLNGVTPEQLRSIHKVKKELDGEVIG